MKILLFLLLLTLPGPGLVAQVALLPERTLSALPGLETRPAIRAVKLEAGETISVDGTIDEAAWKRATPATDFVQQDPKIGQLATERTEVRILFNEHSLYLGVICFDSEPTKLRRNQMLRDGTLPGDDRFIWTIDPFLNGINGYYFETNPSGLMGDALLIGAAGGGGGGAGGGGGGGGGGGEQVRGWDGIWYEKVQRTDIGWTVEVEIPFRTLAFDPHAPAWGINFQRTVRRTNEESLWNGWARNQGVSRMSNAGLLEGLSEINQGVGLNAQPYVIGKIQEAPGQNLPTTYKGTFGGDLIYSVTPQLKATFTINTDFAETEVDQRQVNLTQFPLFFPEKRTFFLEGSNFLDFSREPDNGVTPYFSRSIGLNADGTPQRINFGAKVTGQVGAYDIGFLQVQTANVGPVSGEEFTVFRGRRRIFRQSYVGTLFTRRADRGGLIDSRQTAGVDFSLNTSQFRGSQNLEFSGYYLWNTNLAGTPGGNSLFGVRLDYPNDRWNARVSYREIQENWNPAVGFVDRRNARRYTPVVEFRPRPRNSRYVRRYVYGANMMLFTDLDNVVRSRTLTLTAFRAELQSGDNIQVLITPSFERLERDFRISRGITLPKDVAYTFTRGSVQVQTANRRMFAVDATYSLGTFYSGDRKQAQITLSTRPRPGFLFTTYYEWNRVELPEGNFSTNLYRMNTVTQVSPFVSLSNNVQYDNVSRALGWQARFRWIVKPGNDLYLVYTHNWLSDPLLGLQTFSRGAATKITYMHQF